MFNTSWTDLVLKVGGQILLAVLVILVITFGADSPFPKKNTEEMIGSRSEQPLNANAAAKTNAAVKTNAAAQTNAASVKTNAASVKTNAASVKTNATSVKTNAAAQKNAAAQQ